MNGSFLKAAGIRIMLDCGSGSTAFVILAFITISWPLFTGRFPGGAIPDVVIGGGLTDDYTQTANAGRSPHSQLRSGNREVLHPRGRRVRATLQQTARPAWCGGDPPVPRLPIA